MTYNVKRSHPHPERPRVADHHDIAIIGQNMRVMFDQKIAGIRRLQPVIAIPMKRYAEFPKALGQGNDVLLQVSLLILTVEVYGRNFHGVTDGILYLRPQLAL